MKANRKVSGAGLQQTRAGKTSTQEQSTTVRRDRNGFIKCRVCGCTEVDACPSGCAWVEMDLCSVCSGTAFQVAEMILRWRENCRRANKAALDREIAGYMSGGAQ